MQKEQIKLTIGGVPEHFNFPFKDAIAKGLFSGNGLDLNWVDMWEGTGQMIKGLQDKSLDVAVLLTEGVTKAILQGLDAKVLQMYVVSPLRWGVHVPYNSTIERVEQLEGQTFAISRYGSGSHLMAFVKADQEGWNLDELKFEVVGDVHGGMNALKANTSQAFLWEKYTTNPFVEKGDCRFIDEVVTPWPCFTIAVRTEVYEQYKDLLEMMCQVVNQSARNVKDSTDMIEQISENYDLKCSQVKNWLNEVNWNYDGKSYDEAFEKTVSYLTRLNLITVDEASNWKDKLFIK